MIIKELALVLLFTHFVFTSAHAQLIGQHGVTGAGGTFSQYLSKTLLKNATKNTSKEAAINAFNNIENTIGTRFLFNTWVDGDSVINAQGNLINTTSFIFNFDKMTGNLLATQDKINNMAVAPTGINSFILKDKGKKYPFEHVKAIDSFKFFLVLVKSEAQYSLYKRFVTKFIESNFRNDGIIQTGHDYDEYKDESQYYIVRQSTGISENIILKPKVMKAVLKDNKEKVDVYFSQHKSDPIDEIFLVGLITYLNQQ